MMNEYRIGTLDHENRSNPQIHAIGDRHAFCGLGPGRNTFNIGWRFVDGEVNCKRCIEKIEKRRIRAERKRCLINQYHFLETE